MLLLHVCLAAKLLVLSCSFLPPLFSSFYPRLSCLLHSACVPNAQQADSVDVSCLARFPLQAPQPSGPADRAAGWRAASGGADRCGGRWPRLLAAGSSRRLGSSCNIPVRMPAHQRALWRRLATSASPCAGRKGYVAMQDGRAEYRQRGGDGPNKETNMRVGCRVNATAVACTGAASSAADSPSRPSSACLSPHNVSHPFPCCRKRRLSWQGGNWWQSFPTQPPQASPCRQTAGRPTSGGAATSPWSCLGAPTRPSSSLGAPTAPTRQAG